MSLVHSLLFKKDAHITSSKLLEWNASEELRDSMLRLVILVFLSNQQRPTQCIQVIKGEINLLLKAQVKNKLENCSEKRPFLSFEQQLVWPQWYYSPVLYILT